METAGVDDHIFWESACARVSSQFAGRFGRRAIGVGSIVAVEQVVGENAGETIEDPSGSFGVADLAGDGVQLGQGQGHVDDIRGFVAANDPGPTGMVGPTGPAKGILTGLVFRMGPFGFVFVVGEGLPHLWADQCARLRIFGVGIDGAAVLALQLVRPGNAPFVEIALAHGRLFIDAGRAILTVERPGSQLVDHLFDEGAILLHEWSHATSPSGHDLLGPAMALNVQSRIGNVLCLVQRTGFGVRRGRSSQATRGHHDGQEQGTNQGVSRSIVHIQWPSLARNETSSQATTLPVF